MTSEEHLREIYGVDVSAGLISQVTEAVMDEVRAWQSRPLTACVDGLKGFPDAIATVYPRTEVQVCIVHMVRNSLAYVNWKERKAAA